MANTVGALPALRIAMVDPKTGLMDPISWAPWALVTTNSRVMQGSGSPEGVVTAPVGALYTDSAGGAGTTLYVKESNTDNTGWIAK